MFGVVRINSGGLMRTRSAKFSTVIVGVAISIATVVLPVAPAEAASKVKITRVYYDSPGTPDSGSNRSLNGEWVRIKNTGSKAVSLTGWTLRDKTGFTYRFGTFKLGAGKSVTIRTGSGTDTAKNRFWGQDWYVWNNSGDKAILKNGSGKTVDTCKWGSGPGYTNC